ncbi:ABC transporter permease [Roseibium aestuarii]|uniref:ABC transporter permease n=1 Tax=Roseibium aestuarii TaxID=2600299 RepID=A0ABW4JTE2_9HYPH|nr:iron ABC transporter permease [Roseibium aestuarii]
MNTGHAGRSEHFWSGLSIAAAALVLVPLLAIGWIALTPSGDVWDHLVSTVLPDALATTLLMMAGVGSLTLIIGVGTAWLTTMCRFPGRGLFDWLLLVPLAVPTYIIAFAYVEALDYTGPVQSTLRAVMGFKTSRDYWFPEVRSLGGAILVMSFVLYPYVYLTSRAAFLLQTSSMLDVSRTLGASPLRVFLAIALPMARPAAAVGVSLALMECLNDIGAVTFFGVRTLTFSVYETWLNRSSLGGAAQLAIAMLLMVFALLWVERRARRHQRFNSGHSKQRQPSRIHLNGLAAPAALIACALPVLLGFGVPALILVEMAARRLELFSDPALHRAIGHSLQLAAIASVLTVALSVALAYGLRLRDTPVLRLAIRFSSIGYAIPGAVLAVGILTPLAALDGILGGALRALFGDLSGPLLLGSGVGLIYAYSVRFLAVSYGQIDSGFGKISPHLDMVSRTLGSTAARTLWQVHLPLLKPVLLSALLLTFVDCMKELPATVLLRPFNFDTLATTVFEAASREAFEEAALPALAIVLVGLIPVILLARTSARSFRDATSRRESLASAAASLLDRQDAPAAAE